MRVMTDVRWTGREGEKIFSLLCSRRMVTCNRAEEDDRGWDFILQFPASSIVNVPIDQRSVGPAALVQIKATRVDAQHWSISLKNALSLARSPLPAFIVCVGLDGSGRDTFRAVHIWRSEIVRILKAARQAHVEGDEATNRRTISFDLSEETARVDVLDWMISEIDEVGENGYAAAKQLLVDTLGFDEGHGIARVRLATASPDALTDLQLGILKSLDLNYFSYTPSRFGIESPTPDIEVNGGTLTMIPQGRHGTLRLRSSGGQQAYLPAEVFSAVLPGRRRTKGRVKAGCIDMVLKTRRQITVKCTLDRDEKTTLENIAAFALVRKSTRDSPLAISLRTGASFVDFGHINMKPNANPGWQQLFLITEALRKLVEFENAPPIQTSLNVINSRFVPLSILDALVASRELRIEFTPVVEVKGKVGAFLAYVAIDFAGTEIGAVASRPVLADEMIGLRRRIDFGPATILHASIDHGCVGSIPDLYMKELDRISETVDVLAVGDLQRCVSMGEDRELIVDEPRRTPLRLLGAPDCRVLRL